MPPSPDDHAALMQAANRGDAAAYRRLLGELVPLLRAGARGGLKRAGRGPEDAEDIVQETLLAIHLKRHTWDERLPLLPWVRAIAHHKLVDALRRRGYATSVPIEDFESVLHTEEVPFELSAVACAEMLARLPTRQATIVQSIAIEGHSTRDVAEQLGMTEVAVRVALHRTLKQLADRLRQDSP